MADKQAIDSNLGIKEVELRDGENKLKCEIQIIGKFFQASIYDSDNTLLHQGDIHVNRIRAQIYAFTDVRIGEIFDEINKLENDKFKLLKEQKKLQIEFTILDRKKYITICLNDDISNNDYIRTIKELKEQIKDKNNRIKIYEEIFSKQKKIKGLKGLKGILGDSANSIFKNPKHVLQYHTEPIFCTAVLKDGRIATGSKDKEIIVFNNKTFKPDLTIKEHNGVVVNMIELSTGYLASCSEDKTIKIYDVGLKTYKVIQTLKDHTGWVSKIIELNNKQLMVLNIKKIFLLLQMDGMVQ